MSNKKYLTEVIERLNKSIDTLNLDDMTTFFSHARDDIKNLLQIIMDLTEQRDEAVRALQRECDACESGDYLKAYKTARSALKRLADEIDLDITDDWPEVTLPDDMPDRIVDEAIELVKNLEDGIRGLFGLS